MQDRTVHRTSIMNLMIRHFSHPHQLTLQCSQSPFRCDGCKEIGFGSCYQCEYPNCRYYLHDACAEASPTAFHPFFEGTVFSFDPQPPHTIVHCDACGNSVQGYRYHSSNIRPDPHPDMKLSIDLHPVCLKLKYVLENSNGLKLHLREKVSYSRYHLSSVLRKKCQHCESAKLSKWLKGWAYVSSDGAHRYHVACVRDLVYDKWKSKYLQGRMSIYDYIANGGSSSMMPPLSVMHSTSQSHAVVQHNNSSSSRPMFLRIAKIVIELIISAIFGQPTGMFFAAAELLWND